jgi:hypothetical protein
MLVNVRILELLPTFRRTVKSEVIQLVLEHPVKFGRLGDLGPTIGTVFIFADPVGEARVAAGNLALRTLNTVDHDLEADLAGELLSCCFAVV